MTNNPDRLDRAMRMGSGILLFVFAAILVAYVSELNSINHWVGFSILSLGYLVGRVARGIER